METHQMRPEMAVTSLSRCHGHQMKSRFLNSTVLFSHYFYLPNENSDSETFWYFTNNFKWILWFLVKRVLLRWKNVGIINIRGYVKSHELTQQN